MVEDLINPRHLSHWGSRSETASRPRPKPAPSLSLSLLLLQVNLRDVLLAACLIDCSWSRRRSRNCWNRCQIVQHFVLLSFFCFFFFLVLFIFLCVLRLLCCSCLLFSFVVVHWLCGFEFLWNIFASPPMTATPSSTSQLENASLFQVYRFVSPASEREKGNELVRARVIERETVRGQDTKSCKCWAIIWGNLICATSGHDICQGKWVPCWEELKLNDIVFYTYIW